MRRCRLGRRPWCPASGVEPGELAGQFLSSDLVGSHYDGTNNSGEILNVSGTCGGQIAFGTVNVWDDIISSTRQRSCGVIKHFENTNFSGDLYVHDGATNTLHNLGAMSNRTSSVTYD